ncbi:MAG: HAD-IB family hydrolase [Actinobacteria bacterium]|nr:HAD-IB family hydrolase [Actinomycetota bacterium]
MRASCRSNGESRRAHITAWSSRLNAMTTGRVAAFFDVDNTVVRGASLFHLARSFRQRGYFRARDIRTFIVKQSRFVLSGKEYLTDIASVQQAALAFVAGRSVEEMTSLAAEVFDERLADKLWHEVLELAHRHRDAGTDVWLVTATPVEVADLMAHRLGLSGALGTVSEVVDGVYTGNLVGSVLHGKQKAIAVKALAEREGINLAASSAYSDSANDLPLLESVGLPHVVNPDRALKRIARERGWPILEFRSRRSLARWSGRQLSLAGAIVATLVALFATR